MAFYPTPNITDTSNLEHIFSWTNSTASDGVMLPSVMLALWFIVIGRSVVQGNRMYKGFIYGNLVCAIISIPFGLLGWINPTFIYFFIILLGIGLLWARFTD